MLERFIGPLLSPSFLRYGLVGGSGFFVNLLVFAVLKDLLEVHQNLAYVVGIECAVLSNFILNDRWTFRDRQDGTPWNRRLAKFHVVSAVGMALNQVAFMVAIMVLFSLLSGGDEIQRYFAGDASWVSRHVLRPVFSPPDVGFPWTYFAPVAGLAAATLWNFFANFFWTWKANEEGDDSGGIAVGPKGPDAAGTSKHTP